MSPDGAPGSDASQAQGLDPGAVRASADEVYGRVQQLKEHL